MNRLHARRDGSSFPAFVLRRLGASLLLLFLVLSAVFVLLRLVPGDPLGDLAALPIPQHQKDLIIRAYGLDRPLAEQYVRWLAAVALHGNWGISYEQQRPAATVVAEAIPPSLLLAAAALLVEYGVGVTLGVTAARHRGRAIDRLIAMLSLVLYSQPAFWVGILAVMAFSYHLHWFPASHMHSVGAADLGAAANLADLARHLALPALTLGLIEAGAAARFVRASLLDVADRDYIRTARAAGVSERRILWVHSLRPALVPLVQILGTSVPNLLSGVVVIESVFAWPGLGRVSFEAILSRDFPVVIAATAFSAALVVAGNFAADLLHAWIDPRLREPARG